MNDDDDKKDGMSRCRGGNYMILFLISHFISVCTGNVAMESESNVVSDSVSNMFWGTIHYFLLFVLSLMLRAFILCSQSIYDDSL